MTENMQIVCELLGKALFDAPITRDLDAISEEQWYEIYNLCAKQTVLPTVAPVIPKSAPKKLRYQWIADVYQVQKRNYEVTEANFLIHELLTQNNIPYVFLKGLSSQAYYPADYLRAQGDVDFLIEPEKFEKAKGILLDNGFTLGSELPYEKGFSKNGVSFDLHIEMNGIPEGKCGENVRYYLSDIISSAERRNIDGNDVLFPDKFHHGLILLLHTARHMVGFGLGLRQICDWTVFANSVGEDFPEMFKDPLEKMGLWKFAQSLSAVCVKYLKMPDFSWIPQYSDDFLLRFMDDLTRKGNLCHDNDDKMDTLLVENSNHGGVAPKPMIIQFFSNLGEKAKYRWHFMNKWKILIPFGVIIMCTQYGFGMITGKYHKVNLSEMARDAAERKKLYREISLFENNMVN